jgi:hypothetical protein
MPTSSGISSIPPDSWVLPNDRRGKPAIGSKPTETISRPRKALTKPLAMEASPPIEAMMVRASTAMAKNSPDPNDSA